MLTKIDVSGEVTSFDPYSPDVMNDPFTAYAKARAECPVMKVDRLDPEFYIVSRYEDVKAVITDHKQWTKNEGSLLRRTDERNIALNQDPPDFLEFRRVYASFMSPKGVEKFAEPMARFIDEYLDAIVPLGKGDFHDLLARPLPVRVMALLLGLPDSGLDQYRVWTDYFLTTQFNEPDPELGKQMMRELYGFFGEQFAKRRALLEAAGVDVAGPEHIGTIISDDLLSLLLVSRFRGRPLNEQEMFRTTRGFFVGNDTFTSLLLNLLRRLLEDRSRWDAVKSDVRLIDAAIDESLRFDPPSLGMFREAACPVELHGVTVPQGARMHFALPGANRDPTVFDRPDEFRLDRPISERNRHLAFGNGAHFCPGASIARLEARIAIAKLIERMPDLRITGELERIAPFNFWGVKTFPAAW